MVHQARFKPNIKCIYWTGSRPVQHDRCTAGPKNLNDRDIHSLGINTLPTFGAWMLDF